MDVDNEGNINQNKHSNEEMETNRLTQVEEQSHNCGPDKYTINLNTETKNSNAETKMGNITNPTSPNADNYQPGMESAPT
ncbi:hypothetical protein AX774_g6279 [Zancudomyces culisetae]|uniref:Uncharacterized protein n=1 Tax=Zancudomyces culisetae TaxID=1213189 RepID=A0A1R1PH33_ZANCU|nr:hypothetical protein AX774_g6279 [Zancudomyces culisetae]|eukprot:OMH80286.1 hypothetical protein AX774_g6279 [Zancudomyces culisetae]